ncbi:MAG: hypothetical protein C7B47_11855 [Sulfobacillus thermosulfidooxidans]|uniref:EAL domain-containing protein n=1 Tax=Sulfobacillus thermosulfidooxidans TaxID=28034 RepID=A0A2T2WTK6_SULTH|nr:MAG: hypothetical protein C7B47_11855 [Sulfobacillus thermosulfidooxidans]
MDNIVTIAWLKDRGYGFALDDAGTYFTGFQLYALWPYVVQLSLSVLHGWHLGHPEFLRYWVNAAHRIQAIVIAEGVEDKAWILALEAEGVDAVQGYALGKPEPAQAWVAPSSTISREGDCQL